MSQATITPCINAYALELADWRDIQVVLRDSHNIWSSGLDKSTYYEYIWWQMHHPWSRKNYRYFVYKNKAGEVVSSLKLYTIRFVSRHKSFKIAGVGAVYTPEKFRGHGYAAQCLVKIHQLCQAEGYDGCLLFSDIGLDYYLQFGYEPLGACDFYIWLPGSSSDPAEQISQLPDLGPVASERYDIVRADLALVPPMVRYYDRWREGLPFAVERTSQYWHYKLARERYVAERSRRKFARIELLTTAADHKGSRSSSASHAGYALIEATDEILRVLEVIGSPDHKERLWLHIVRLAVASGVEVIRGWEASSPGMIKGTRFVERDYSVPMLLSFNPEVAKWREALPCPLLEMDHF